MDSISSVHPCSLLPASHQRRCTISRHSSRSGLNNLHVNNNRYTPTWLALDNSVKCAFAPCNDPAQSSAMGASPSRAAQDAVHSGSCACDDSSLVIIWHLRLSKCIQVTLSLICREALCLKDGEHPLTRWRSLTRAVYQPAPVHRQSRHSSAHSSKMRLLGISIRSPCGHKAGSMTVITIEGREGDPGEGTIKAGEGAKEQATLQYTK